MAHGVMEEWCENEGSEKSPGPPSQGSGRVMGSRRIFAPQFKLQVLDSYRFDADCKGNQRATARKYGIHRRQIQKWLQMESHLRSLTGSSNGGPSSPGGGSSVSLSSPVPSPSPSSSHSLLVSENIPVQALQSLPLHAGHVAMTAATAALNLSCEARLLGGVRGAIGGASPSPASGSGSPPLAPLAAYAASSSSLSPQGSPACSPAPHQGHQAHQVVPVPRLSASPTLPIKKRWCQSPEQPPVTSPPPLPLTLASDEDDDDEEDIDVDGDGTESEASSALDYTSATLSKRRSFSLQFKLEVLDAFREDPHCQGNQRATARAFGINRRQVQKWLGQEPDLRDEAVSRGGLNRQRLGRWMDQDEAATPTPDTGCLDLSRKRKYEPATSDLDDAETEAKRSRVRPDGPVGPAGPAVVTPGPRPALASPLGEVEAFRPLPSHPLLFRPQPVNHPLIPPLPLPLPLSLPHLPFNLCAKQYSVDLKLTTFDYFTHQQNLQKWFKPEEFLKHTNNASFLLNSFR